MMVVDDETTGQMIVGTDLSPGMVTKMKVPKPFSFSSGSYMVRFLLYGGGTALERDITISVVV